MITLGILTLDQKSSKCSFIFEGLYLEYRIPNSVNIPMCALSRPKGKLVCIFKKSGEYSIKSNFSLHERFYNACNKEKKFFLKKLHIFTTK